MSTVLEQAAEVLSEYFTKIADLEPDFKLPVFPDDIQDLIQSELDEIVLDATGGLVEGKHSEVALLDEKAEFLGALSRELGDRFGTGPGRTLRWSKALASLGSLGAKGGPVEVVVKGAGGDFRV